MGNIYGILLSCLKFGGSFVPVRWVAATSLVQLVTRYGQYWWSCLVFDFIFPMVVTMVVVILVVILFRVGADNGRYPGGADKGRYPGLF